MGFSVSRSADRDGGYTVTVHVALTMAETNALFLSGDTMISWPEGELRGGDCCTSGTDQVLGNALPRTGMFISEIARLAQGLKIGYRQAAEAERAAQLVRLQLSRSGIEEVS